MRVVCISDTHGKHDLVDVPPGDILIHAGDFSIIGTHNQLRRFGVWLSALPHAHKIVVAGNHEYSLDAAWYVKGGGRKRHKAFQDPAISKQILSNVCIYLENEAVDVLGVRIYGSPNSPVIPGHTMAFNLMPGTASSSHWKAVPDNVDILITHTPPHGILDKNFRGQTCGDEALAAEVLTRIRPQLHVFGHIHEGYGTVLINETTYVNASSCNLRHQPENPPIVFDIGSPAQ
ncbi:hypothetical protein H310_10543 [Aphanomyces invadans]|uniref:Calcineurin-like phosphoesterase domain-containing protein n=1 Tax=Aphanomyces invadans TaxID=157072 RepID=A0A024TQK2_9STRA|nr:hypothetical protein H310_10543 [Aphanomyces invadans]ETV96390.1 hypothetical protein H310_10543 [Aphanomyces invadans]|eukprot:XP_008875182.1 hypothetical protein H310_10543 [Aphanomyces invadans]